jgi:hypothetical protein
MYTSVRELSPPKSKGRFITKKTKFPRRSTLRHSTRLATKNEHLILHIQFHGVRELSPPKSKGRFITKRPFIFGGERGIWTLGTFNSSHDFQAADCDILVIFRLIVIYILIVVIQSYQLFSAFLFKSVYFILYCLMVEFDNIFTTILWSFSLVHKSIIKEISYQFNHCYFFW